MPESSAAKRTPMARKASKLANRAGLPNADRFGQFDLQKLGGQGHIGQHPLYLVVERWPNLAGGHIDGKTERLPCRSLPLVHLATGLAQHPRAYFRHQAERLGQRQELAGRQQAKPRMPPAHQRFRASDPVIAQIDQRLVMQVKLSAPPPPAPTRAAVHPAGCELVMIRPGRRAAAALRPERNKPVSASAATPQCSPRKATGGRPGQHGGENRQMAGAGQHGQRTPQVAGNGLARLGRQFVRGVHGNASSCARSAGMEASCALRWANAARRRSTNWRSTGKLRCGLCAVRCVERTAQPRQGIQADTRLEGRAHEPQPLQGRIVEHAVAARGAGHRP
uniref:Uncharacterized protein n=1 Tax=Klebsiella pneumoniae TaxID=573 RepID=A0A6M4NXJ5_KLEPN|nr:hypothetical protein [Klebsiella pneumoniae]